MSRSDVSSSDKSKSCQDFDIGEARKLTINNYIDKATRMIDTENHVSECNNLTPGKRQRNRKLSNPQKRLKHVDTHQNLEVMQDVTVATHSSELQQKWQAKTCPRSVQVEDRSQESTQCEGRIEENAKSYEDVDGGIKTETVNGFIVDQWYDLGPSHHKDGHSPVPFNASEVEKMENNEYLEDLSCTSTSQPNPCIDGDSKWSTKAVNMMRRTLDSGNEGDVVNSLQMVHLDRLNFSTGNDTISSLAEPKHVKESREGIGPENISHNHSLSVPSSLFHCPLPNGPPFFSYNPEISFPLSMPIASTYIHTAASINSFTYVNTLSSSGGGSLTVTPSGLYSYATCLDLTKSVVAYSYVQLDTDNAGSKHCPEDEIARVGEPTSQRGTASIMNTTLTTSGVSKAVSTISESFHTPTVTDNFSSTSYPRFGGSVPYPSLLYSNNLYQGAPFQQSGMVLVPSRPFYVQHMPYMPVLPKINYSQPQTSMSGSTTTYVHSGLQISKEEVSSKLVNNLNTPTCSEGQYFSRIPSPKISTSLEVDSSPSLENDKCNSWQTSWQQHHSRAKVKSKMATWTDFIDPTRIKFGVDDVDTDDDLPKLNDGSDCSDKEWQPNKRLEKITGWRESGGSDGWTTSGIQQSDSPLKRNHDRRRKRASKDSAKCEECGKVFQGIYYLRRHMMSHSDIRPYQCEICQKSFKQKAHLIGHLIVHDRALKQRSVDIKNTSPKSKPHIAGVKCPGRPKKTYTEKELACKECGKAFKTVYRLKRHELSHTDVRPFSCRICGKGFKQTGHRNEHEANHEKTKKRFLCNLCGVVFRSRSSFNNHMRSHVTERLRLQAVKGDMDGYIVENKAEVGEMCHTGYDCPYCTDKFATAQALNNHLETHVEVQQRRHVQPYTCDVCRRTFTYRHNLIKHKLIHKAPDKFAQFYQEKVDAHVASGKPSFKCSLCAKVFIRKETLAKHSKIHSGNKPFKCLICSREFTQNVHLKVHMRKHTGSRPFQCKECSRSFIDSTALAKHIEYEACNTDNYLYHCKICDKLHYYMGSLKQHIRKKHSIKEDEVESYILKSERSSKRKATTEGEKHPCKVCLSSFSEKCNLVRHIRRKHAGLVELLQKELELKTAYNQTGESTHRDDVDKYSDEDKGSVHDSPNNWSTREITERGRGVDSDTANANGGIEVVSKQFKTEEDLCKGNVYSTRDQTCDNRAAGADLTNNSPHREDWTTETATARGIDNLDISSAEHSDRNLKLKCAEEEEQNADVFLEGFRMNDLPLSDCHADNNSEQECVLCKQDCYSELPDGGCLRVESDYFIQREPGASLSKDSVEENSYSETDINFLYNIGLIVSNKAKTSRDSRVKQKLNCPCRNCSDCVYFPANESCRSFGKNMRLHRHEVDGQMYGKFDENIQGGRACYRPLEVVIQEEKFTVRSKTSPPRNDTRRKNVNIESKQDLKSHICGEGVAEGSAISDVSGARGVLVIKSDSKQRFKFREDRDIPLLHGGENSCQSTLSKLDDGENSCQSTLSKLDDGENICPSTLNKLQEGENSVCQSTLNKLQEGEKSVCQSTLNKLQEDENSVCQSTLNKLQEDENSVCQSTLNKLQEDKNSVCQSILNRYALTNVKSSSGVANTETESCMKIVLKETDSCQTSVSDSSCYFCQEMKIAADSRVMLELRPKDDITREMSVSPKTQDHNTLIASNRNEQNTDDASKQVDHIIHCKKVADTHQPGTLASLARTHGQNNCHSQSTATNFSTSATSMNTTLDQAQFEPSLVNSSEIQSSSETINELQMEPLLLTEALNLSQGGTHRLPCSSETRTVNLYSQEANPHSDNLQPLKTNFSVTDSGLARNNTYEVICEHLKCDVSDLTKSTISNVARIESQNDRKLTTDTHPYTHPNCILTPTDRSNQSEMNVTSRVPMIDSSMSDYEACPSESHLNYLGLLACTDAQAIKNKDIPLEDLYETYKPWLEDLVHKTRPRRTKLNKASTLYMDIAHKDTKIDSISLQIKIQQPSPCGSTDPTKQNIKSTSMEKAEIFNDNTRQSHIQSTMCKRKRRLNAGELIPDQENTEEQYSQETATTELPDIRCLHESGHSRASSSSSDHQFLVTVTPSLTLSTIHTQTESLKSFLPMTTSTSTSSSTEPAAKVGHSLSRSSTPDSVVKGRQLYSCSVCSKYFTARHQLKRHEMSHTNHRPYNCEQCGRAFRQKVHLSDHVKRHQGQRPFVCAGCGKRFVLKNEMNQHIKNHCRATVDAINGHSLKRVRNNLPVPVRDLSPMSSTEPLTKLDSKNFTAILGQSYQ